MITSLSRRALSVLVAGVLTISAAAPSFAAAVPASSAAVKSIAAGNVVDVHWRRHGGAVFGGVAAGLALGAIAGAAARPYYAPGPTYYYDEPAYVYDGDPAPYYAPPPPPPRPYGRCWVQTDDRGYGHWRPC